MTLFPFLLYKLFLTKDQNLIHHNFLLFFLTYLYDSLSHNKYAKNLINYISNLHKGW